MRKHGQDAPCGRVLFIGLSTAAACAMGHTATLDEQFDAVARDLPAVSAAVLPMLRDAGAPPAALVEAARAAAVIAPWDSTIDDLAAPALPRAIDAARAAGDTTTAALLGIYQLVIQIADKAPAAEQSETMRRLQDEVGAAGQPTARCQARLLKAISLRSSVQESDWAGSYLDAIGTPGASERCHAMALSDMAFVNGFGIDRKNVREDLVNSVLDRIEKARQLSPEDRFPSLAGRLFNAEATTQQLAGEKHAPAARQAIQGAIAIARRTGDRILLYAGLSSLAAWTRKYENPAAAIPILEESRGLTPPGSADHMTETVRLAAAYAALKPPNRDRVHELLAEARADLDGVGKDTVYRRVYLSSAVRAYKALGEFENALAAQDELVDLERQQASAENLARLDEMQTRFRVQQTELENERLRTAEAVNAGRRTALAVGLGVSAVGLLVLGGFLAFQVRQRRRIARLYAQLEALSASRSEFMVAACHDLRQPAHALSLLAEVAARSPSGDGRRYVDDIRRTTGVLGDLLSQVLDMTQLERGDYAVHVGPVDLAALLSEVEAQYRGQCERKGLQLSVRATDAWVHSDAQLLRRILFNLVSNAVKYTDRGSVSVRVLLHGGRAMLQVKDTGRGMPEDRIGELLMPYARVDASSTDEGLGIGLSVVHRGARLLSHKLDIQSRLGAGTQVTLELPVCEPAILPAEPAATGARRALVGVVEDNAEVRAAMAELLRQWKFDVAEAASQDELLQRLRSHGDAVPALLLIDYAVDRDNGIDLVRRLRQRTGWAAVPAILVTGAATADVESRAQAIGARVVLKPARPARLLRAIESAIAAVD